MFHSRSILQTNSMSIKQLIHPFSLLIVGKSGVGKTELVKRLLCHIDQVVSPPPQRIIYCYSIWQPAYEEMKNYITNIEFVKGIPEHLEEDDFINPLITNLILFDDVISDALEDKRLGDLFTKGSHHRNLSVILISQNLFHKGKEARTISLNAHYMILFNNPRDVTQIQTLARQMQPGKTHQFLRKYKEIVSKPYASLFIDLKTTTPDGERLSDTEQLFVGMSAVCGVEDTHTFSSEVHKHENSSQTIKNSNVEKESAETVMNDVIFTCEFCGCLFISEYDLERHEKECCPHHESYNLPTQNDERAWELLFVNIEKDINNMIGKKLHGHNKNSKKNIPKDVIEEIYPKIITLFMEQIQDTLIKFNQIYSNKSLMGMLNDAKRLPLDLKEAIPIIIQSKSNLLNDILYERLFKTATRK